MNKEKDRETHVLVKLLKVWMYKVARSSARVYNNVGLVALIVGIDCLWAIVPSECGYWLDLYVCVWSSHQLIGLLVHLISSEFSDFKIVSDLVCLENF